MPLATVSYFCDERSTNKFALPLFAQLAHARAIALAYLQSAGQRNHASAWFVLVT